MKRVAKRRKNPTAYKPGPILLDAPLYGALEMLARAIVQKQVMDFPSVRARRRNRA